MPSELSKPGLWLFLLSVLWFAGGNILLGALHKNSSTAARQPRPVLQFDVGTQLVFDTRASQTYTPDLYLVLDPGASRVSVTNNNPGIAVQGQMLDGVLHLSIFDTVKAQNFSRARERLLIHVPASVRKMDFPARAAIGMSSDSAATIPELDLTLTNCDTGIHISHLSIRRLKLSHTCQPLAGAPLPNNYVEMREHLSVEQLEITMPAGRLQYTSDIIPQEIQLNLGSKVLVNARNEFIRSAHFGKLP